MRDIDSDIPGTFNESDAADASRPSKRSGARVERIGPSDLLRPQEQPDESVGGGEGDMLNVLRPRSLREYIGQKDVKANLEIALAAARKRGEPLDHVLFDGPPGLGKTTLAHIIAKEMGTQLTITSGPTLDKGGMLVGILTRLQRGDILFIDEIHRLPRIVEEFLYPAMEDFRFDIAIDKGPHARSVTFQLQRFTLIGATTRKGLLSAPMRERFGIQEHLRFYEQDELAAIVRRSAHILEVELDQDGAEEIARRARGTPRIANRLLHRVRDYALVRANGRVDRGVADAALARLGVDPLGLDDLDRRLLRMVVEHYSGGPVGINAMAATLQEEPDTLTDVVEPYLLKIGFIVRTPRGRMATPRACQHLGLGVPLSLRSGMSDESQLGLFDDDGGM